MLTAVTATDFMSDANSFSSGFLRFAAVVSASRHTRKKPPDWEALACSAGAYLRPDPPNRHLLPKTEKLDQKNNDQGDQDGIQCLYDHALRLSRAVPTSRNVALLYHTLKYLSNRLQLPRR